MHKNIYITNLTNCWIKKVVFTKLTVKVGLKKTFFFICRYCLRSLLVLGKRTMLVENWVIEIQRINSFDALFFQKFKFEILVRKFLRS